VAPRVLGGRLLRKDARTTPLLPIISCQHIIPHVFDWLCGCTVCPPDLAPDASNLASSDLLLCPVNVDDLLAKVEAVDDN